MSSEFLEFDEKGIPTVGADGKPVSEVRRSVIIEQTEEISEEVRATNESVQAVGARAGEERCLI